MTARKYGRWIIEGVSTANNVRGGNVARAINRIAPQEGCTILSSHCVVTLQLEWSAARKTIEIKVDHRCDEKRDYLRKQQWSLSGTNEFDIVYQGSLDELKDIPRGAVAIIRDRQSWTAPSGKQARLYGLADGSSQIVESDDNFAAWEAEHIFSPTPSGR